MFYLYLALYKFNLKILRISRKSAFVTPYIGFLGLKRKKDFILSIKNEIPL